MFQRLLPRKGRENVKEKENEILCMVQRAIARNRERYDRADRVQAPGQSRQAQLRCQRTRGSGTPRCVGRAATANATAAPANGAVEVATATIARSFSAVQRFCAKSAEYCRAGASLRHAGAAVSNGSGAAGRPGFG